MYNKSGATGGGSYDRDAYYAEYRRRREESAAAAREEQKEIDSIADPAARREANRSRYKCGPRFVALDGIAPWPVLALSLIPLKEHTTKSTKGSGGAGGGFGFFSRSDEVTITADDVAARYPADETLASKISLFQGDITALEVDAIVNAANQSLMGGGGIDGAIHSAAGDLLLEECEKLGGCETGSAKITRGYRLPAANVLHAVGPIGGGDRKLRGCYQTCLELLKANGLRSIAFCCISTGIFGFPLVRATHIALTVVREWLQVPENAASVDRIIFCTFRDVEQQCYERITPSYFPVPGLPVDQTKLAKPVVDFDAPEPEVPDRTSSWGGAFGGGGF